jgi:hypothetical protein
MIQSQYINSFQVNIDAVLQKCSIPSKYAALSAVRHVEKAIKIRNIDYEMCAFRLITAEEEASTAIFMALKQKKYLNAERIRHHDHIYKNSVIPFLRAISTVFKKEIIDKLKPRIEFSSKDEIVKISVIHNLSGKEYRVNANPPLNFNIEFNDNKLKYEELLKELANSKNKKYISEYLKESANIRNLILYAGPKGLHSIPDLSDNVIKGRIDHIYLLISIYTMIDQHNEIQFIAQDCLTEFVNIIDKIKK